MRAQGSKVGHLEVLQRLYLLTELAARGRWCLEEEEDSSRAVVGINEGHIDAIDQEGSVQRQRLDAAGVDVHVFDQQIGGDSAAVDGAGAEGCGQACGWQYHAQTCFTLHTISSGQHVEK